LIFIKLISILLNGLFYESRNRKGQGANYSTKVAVTAGTKRSTPVATASLIDTIKKLCYNNNSK